MRSRSIAAAALLVAGLLAPVTAAPSAHAAVVDVTCPTGTQYSTYDPGLTYTARTTTFTAQGSLAPCVSSSHPQIVGATFTAAGTGTASCTTASFADRSVYTWNTGQQSVVEGTLAINIKPDGQTVLVRVGTVVGGLFEGATVVQTKVLPALDLLACLTPQGLTSDSGALSLTVTL
ncbi:hypothetical protein MF672_031095 [Actinomadura sp. ATCC 31491]|uniref:Ig-like domain-containing protein n=1 Tax=Actinomadura luzonensis TaxID=2805427 RepID=A0ABT0G0Z3_9ACTN|nr:hypothetical protein [Actinomadura luzonensis]MCK2218204.1 hypothetical protein [Actinomadura luzonensis]